MAFGSYFPVLSMPFLSLCFYRLSKDTENLNAIFCVHSGKVNKSQVLGCCISPAVPLKAVSPWEMAELACGLHKRNCLCIE